MTKVKIKAIVDFCAVINKKEKVFAASKYYFIDNAMSEKWHREEKSINA